MSKKDSTIVVAIVLGLVIGGLFGVLLSMPSPTNFFTPQSIKDAGFAEFCFCYTGGGRNCVVDGDTIWINGENVRLADIDAPETHPSRCPYEADLGKRATRRLQELLNSGPVQLQAIDRDQDIYGRELRIVTRNGESIGQMLVHEGLARTWIGYRRPWCS